MNQLIIHVAKCKLRLYAWACFFFVEPQLQIVQSMAARRDNRFSNVVHNSMFAMTKNGTYTIEWQLIRIPSKTKDGRVQQFCSTRTIHPLGTCEEEFDCSIIIGSKKLFE